MAVNTPEVSAERIDAIQREFHIGNDIEIEPGFTVNDLTNRDECNRAIALVSGDLNKIIKQVEQARLDNAKGRKLLDKDWIVRAQSAIRWKRRVITAINAKREAFPRPPAAPKMVIVERRKIILEVIQEEIGDVAMKGYVERARARRPELFASPAPVDNGDNQP